MTRPDSADPCRTLTRRRKQKLLKSNDRRSWEGKIQGINVKKITDSNKKRIVEIHQWKQEGKRVNRNRSEGNNGGQKVMQFHKSHNKRCVHIWEKSQYGEQVKWRRKKVKSTARFFHFIVNS